MTDLAQQPTTAPPVAPQVGEAAAAATTPPPSSTAPNPVSTSVTAAKNAASLADPVTVVSAAQSGTSPIDAAQRAKLAEAFTVTAKLSDTLSKAPLKTQLAYWNQSNDAERSLLTAGGYVPPEAPAPRPAAQPARGLWGGLFHDIVHEADNARHGAAGVLDTSSGVLGKVANVGVDPIMHGVRAAFENASVNDLSYQQGKQSLWSDLGALVSPEQWGRAWDATKNGAASFQPEVVRFYQKTLGPQKTKFAMLMAGGASLQQALGQFPEAQRGDLSFAAAEDPKFQAAVTELGDSHLTVGQMAFGGATPSQLNAIGANRHGVRAYEIGGAAVGGAEAGLAKGNLPLAIGGAVAGAGIEAGATAADKTVDRLTTVSPFGLQIHPLSGLADGLVDWYSSPLMMGGQALGEYKAGRYAILDAAGSGRDAMERYESDPNIKAGFDKIADLLTDKGTRSDEAPANVDALLRAPGFGAMTALVSDLVKDYPKILAASKTLAGGGRAVAEFFSGAQATESVARGQAGLFFHGDTMFPHVTTVQKVRAGVQQSLDDLLHNTHGIDAEAQSPRQMLRGLVGLKTEQAVAEAEPRVPGPAARILKRATTIAPTRSYIDLTDKDRAVEVQRYADLALPKEWAARLVNAFMAIPMSDQGAMRDSLRGLTLDMFDQMGLNSTEAGRKYVERWTSENLDRVGKERYSYVRNAWYRNPRSDVDDGAEHALFPGQLSSALRMPEVRDLYRLSKKFWYLEQLGHFVDPEALQPWLDRRMEMHINTGKLVDRFMTMWKASVLFRTGFAIRVAGEEGFGAALRVGLMPLGQARLAASLFGIESPVTDDVRRWLPNVIKAISGHVPGEALDAIRDMRVTDHGIERAATGEEKMDALKAHIVSWKTIDWGRKSGSFGLRPLKALGVSLLPEDVLNAGMWQAVNGRLDGVIRGSFDALTQHGGITGDEVGLAKSIAEGRGASDIAFRPSTMMGASSPRADDPMIYAKFHYGLGLFRHPFGRFIAGAFDQGKDAQIETALKWIRDPANEQEVRRFDVMHQTKDGRLVSTGEASKADAEHDWAEAAVNHVNNMVAPNATRMTRAERRAILDKEMPEHRLHQRQLDRGLSQMTTLAKKYLPEGSELADPENEKFPAAIATVVNEHMDELPADVREMFPEGSTEISPAFVQRMQISQQRNDAEIDALNDKMNSEQRQIMVKLSDDPDAGPQKLATLIGKGIIPETEDLETVPKAELPDEIVARELVPIADKLFDKVIEHGMLQMVGRPLNYLSRFPIYQMHFATAFKEAKAVVASRGLEDAGDMLAGDIATERAWREVMPYIHNPSVRSQLSMMTRTLAPFWFAQEQFYKRWASTFAKYPEALRKAQLTMNGLRAVGFVQKDQYGQDSFAYPASGWVTAFLAKTFGAAIPVANTFTSEISQLNPSFATGNILSPPSVGPLVSIPMSTLNAYLPELDPVVAGMLGPEAPKEDHSLSKISQVGLAMFDQTAPTIVQRAMETTLGTMDPSSPLYVSLMSTAAIQSAQFLEATGHGPPLSENPAEVDAFQNRVSSWARVLTMSRALFGMFSPATPTFKISGSALGDELTALMGVMPYDQAVTEFLKEHPDATAYTIFESTTSGQGQSGAYVPATQGALDFIDANKSFFDKYSAVAPWFFPVSTGQGTFNDNAYLQELANGLRARRDFGDWWQTVRFSEAANVYYPIEQKVAADKLANPGEKTELSHWWDTWSTAFKKANPIFADYDTNASTTRRAFVVQQMQSALADGEVPKSAQTEHLALMMSAFDQVQRYYSQTAGESAFSAERTANKNAYLAWGAQFIQAYPDTAAFWNSVLSKEVPG